MQKEMLNLVFVVVIGLKYSKVDDFKLIGYSDSDFDGDKETEYQLLDTL